MMSKEQDPELVFNLESIGPDGLSVREEVSQDWLGGALGDDSPFRAHQDGLLDIHLERLEDVVHVRGQADFHLEATCCRCLEQVAVRLKTPVQVVMFPENAEPPAGPGGELKTEDMGVSTYQDRAIDLRSVVRDEIFLELPMNPRCEEACRGLCGSCGINLNHETCSCDNFEDSPWSVFKAIKPKAN